MMIGLIYTLYLLSKIYSLEEDIKELQRSQEDKFEIIEEKSESIEEDVKELRKNHDDRFNILEGESKSNSEDL